MAPGKKSAKEKPKKPTNKSASQKEQKKANLQPESDQSEVEQLEDAARVAAKSAKCKIEWVIFKLRTSEIKT